VHSSRRQKLNGETCGLGLVDGGGGDRIPWCDGIPADANAALVRLMQNIVERTLEPPRVRTF
jgi:hypothetical protein